MDDVHCCQACHVLTDRKCSVCGVCVFCSIDCEKRAERMSMARVACAEHQKGTRAPENLGASPIHYVMLPMTPIDARGLKGQKLKSEKLSQRVWEILFHGAKHYLHLLLAASPSTLFEKTAFSMSVVLVGKCENLSAGFQRLNYPLGNPNQAAAMVITNAAKLAHAQLDGAVHKRAVFVVGSVRLDPSPVVHFDVIYAQFADDAWTVKAIKPLWAQTLTHAKQDRHYKLHFRPNGEAPTRPLHPLALVEKALKRSQTTPPKTSPAPTPAPSPTPDENQEPLPPRDPAPHSLPPASERELEKQLVQIREGVREQVKAARVAPPWTEQLQQALPELPGAV